MTMESLGKRIKELRKRLDVGQERLAVAGGISARTLSRLESGASDDVKVSTLEKLAEALGVALVLDMVEPVKAEPRTRPQGRSAYERPVRALPAPAADTDEPGLHLRPVTKRRATHVEYDDTPTTAHGVAEVIDLTERVRQLAGAKQAHLAEAAVVWLGRMKRQDQGEPYTDGEIRRALREVAAKGAPEPGGKKGRG